MHLKGRNTERWRKYKETDFSIHLFTPQLTVETRAGLGPSQDPGVCSESPMHVQGFVLATISKKISRELDQKMSNWDLN